MCNYVPNLIKYDQSSMIKSATVHSEDNLIVKLVVSGGIKLSPNNCRMLGIRINLPSL